MKRKALFLFVLMLIATGGMSCFQKTASSGSDTVIYVVADTETWEKLQPAITETFQKVLVTPQPEKVFDLYWVSPEKFSTYATRKNLLLVGTFDSKGEISQKVSGMLSPIVKEKVKEGTAFYFPKENPWAKKQLLMVLAGVSTSELEKKLIENRDVLYGFFKDRLLGETKKQMYSQLEQKDLSKQLLQKYGWTVRIQHDYIINTERPQDRFVMLRRSLPGRERWLFVHWIDDADSNLINKDWAIAKRNKLTAKFYKNDLIDENYVESNEIDFLDRPALMLEGLWKNEDKFIGGPFRTYVFYDEKSKRIYMIDIAVYYPAGKKEPFFRQLDIMAHTFKTAQDVEERS